MAARAGHGHRRRWRAAAPRCRTLSAQGRPVFVLALEGDADAGTVADAPHAWCRLGAAGEGAQLLRENGVDELVLAGGVRRRRAARRAAGLARGEILRRDRLSAARR